MLDIQAFACEGKECSSLRHAFFGASHLAASSAGIAVQNDASWAERRPILAQFFPLFTVSCKLWHAENIFSWILLCAPCEQARADLCFPIGLVGIESRTGSSSRAKLLGRDWLWPTSSEVETASQPPETVWRRTRQRAPSKFARSDACRLSPEWTIGLPFIAILLPHTTHHSLSSMSRFFYHNKKALKQSPKIRQLRLKPTKLGPKLRYFVLKSELLVI